MIRLIALAGILQLALIGTSVYAQLSVHKLISQELISVRTSSTYSQSSPENLINGSGLDGVYHDNNMVAQSMWHSESNPEPSAAFPETRVGRVWIAFQFDQPYSLKEMWIWNHNQPEYTSRGLKNIHIEYSADGQTWEKINHPETEYFTIPEAKGLQEQEVSLKLNCRALKAKHLVITADIDEGNYGDAYYGLSEIWFVSEEVMPLKEGISLIGDDKVLKDSVPLRKHRLLFPGGVAYGEDEILLEFAGQADTVFFGAITEGVHEKTITLPFSNDYTSATPVQITSLRGNWSRKVIVNPPKKWTIYLFPQSHVDIGYTHHQDEAKKINFQNIEYAISLAERTKDFPKDSRYRFSVEALWVVDEFLLQCTEEQKERLLDAIKKGWINLDGAYASINTSISNGEQLLRLFEYANRLKRKYDLSILSGQQVDVPGMSWGVVTSMDQNEMKYMLNMPNFMEDKTLENNPFYWESPSGSSKILHFQTYYYNLGYEMKGRYIPNYLTGIEEPFYAETPDDLFLDPFIFGYLNQIRDNYPYELIPFAWIMTDNAPLDPDLPEVVKNWNAKYENPNIKISAVLDFFEDFENKYQEQIPVRRGDYTEHWTDGVASGAYETGLNRNNSERILQAETLFAMLSPEAYSPESFDEIWKNILLFSEHTWGSYKSSTHPHDPDVISQWKTKKSYANIADKKIDSLFRVLENAGDGFSSHSGNVITVLNTNSWKRSGVVNIPAALSTFGDLVICEKGDTIVSQRLTTGELAIYVENLDAFRRRKYTIKKETKKSAAVSSPENIINNQFYRARLGNDSQLSIYCERTGAVINDFLSPEKGIIQYSVASDHGRESHNGKLGSARRLESGPLVNSFLFDFLVPGFYSYTIEMRLLFKQDFIEFNHLVNKIPVLDKERLLIRFPLSDSAGTVSYQIPWGVVFPGKDLLPGSNLSYHTVQNFVDASSESEGFTLIPLDAPIIILPKNHKGEYTMSFESLVMDNHWHVNFRAYQDGEVPFRFRIKAHEGMSLSETHRFGVESFQPLIVLEGDIPLWDMFPLKGVEGSGVVLTSCKPLRSEEGLVVRVYNNTDQQTQADVYTQTGYSIFESNNLEKKLNQVSLPIDLGPFEVKTLLITK